MKSVDRATYEVWVSLEPENMTTSAGEVFVMTVRWRAVSPLAAFLKKPIAVCATLLRSPLP